MSTSKGLYLFLVVDGRVTGGWQEAWWDGERSILVAATSKEVALKIAEAYGNGLVKPDYIPWCYSTAYAVAMRDPDTGDYL
jgi:hypothetical protein